MINWLSQPWVLTLGVWLLAAVLLLSLAWDVFAQLVLKARPWWALDRRRGYQRSREKVDGATVSAMALGLTTGPLPRRPAPATPTTVPPQTPAETTLSGTELFSPFRETTIKPWSER